MVVCRCMWESCRVPWRAIVKGVQVSSPPSRFEDDESKMELESDESG